MNLSFFHNGHLHHQTKRLSRLTKLFLSRVIHSPHSVPSLVDPLGRPQPPFVPGAPPSPSPPPQAASPPRQLLQPEQDLDNPSASAEAGDGDAQGSDGGKAPPSQQQQDEDASKEPPSSSSSPSANAMASVQAALQALQAGQMSLNQVRRRLL